MHICNGFFYDPQSDSQYWTLTLRTVAEHNCALLIKDICEIINYNFQNEFRKYFAGSITWAHSHNFIRAYIQLWKNLPCFKKLRKATLALKPRGDVTRSPKQGYQWPHKKDSCPPKITKKKKIENTSETRAGIGTWHKFDDDFSEHNFPF